VSGVVRARDRCAGECGLSYSMISTALPACRANASCRADGKDISPTGVVVRDDFLYRSSLDNGHIVSETTCHGLARLTEQSGRRRLTS
jgi:hypothetical protein